jgi:hypothetical protein
MGMSKLDEIVALFQNESKERNARSHYSKWDYARGKVELGLLIQFRKLWQ